MIRWGAVREWFRRRHDRPPFDDAAARHAKADADQSDWGRISGRDIVAAWPRDVPADQLQQRIHKVVAESGSSGFRQMTYGGTRIEKLLTEHPQMSEVLAVWGELRDTKLAQAIANISKPDVAAWATVLEQQPFATEYRDILAWARQRPRDAQDIVRQLAERAGVGRAPQ